MKLAIASFIYAVERAKDLDQRTLRHPGAMVTDSDHSGEFVRTLVTVLPFDLALELHLNRSVFGRVLHGITYHVFNGATQQLFIAYDAAAFSRFEAYSAFAAARFKVRISSNLTHQRRQVEFTLPDLFSTAFEPRQRQQLPDHLVKDFGFALNAFECC